MTTPQLTTRCRVLTFETNSVWCNVVR